MTYNNGKHLKLVEEFLDSKKKNKKIFFKNSKENMELHYCQIYLQDHLFWTKKNDFVLLMQNYINNSLTLEKFEIAYSLLWNSVMEEFQKIRLNLEALKNFEPSPESEKYTTYITAVYRQFEELDDEICTEQEARDYIVHILDRLNS